VRRAAPLLASLALHLVVAIAASRPAPRRLPPVSGPSLAPPDAPPPAAIEVVVLEVPPTLAPEKVPPTLAPEKVPPTLAPPALPEKVPPTLAASEKVPPTLAAPEKVPPTPTTDPPPAVSEKVPPTAGSDGLATEVPGTGVPGDGAKVPPTQRTRLTMRGNDGGTVVLAPRAQAAALERIAAGGAPLPVDPTTGELAPAGGGRATANERVFSARVARDGTVDLKDARNLQVHLSIPKPKNIGRAVGNLLDEWKKDPYALAKKGGEREPPNLRPKGDQTDKDDKRTPTTIPIIGGSFDIGDAVERWVGNDPYASRKLSFLDRTRDERVAMGERERARLVAATEQTVRRHLERLWSRRDLTLADKRVAVFELWDDCVEGETDDPGAGEAGLRARRHVLGFARARFPAGSPRAYTADELARLNAARQSRARFAPYDD
jgi:hypothetical protein